MPSRLFIERSPSVFLRAGALFLIIAILDACTTPPKLSKIDATRLAQRERIDVRVAIGESALLIDGVKTRGEGANAGAFKAGQMVMDTGDVMDTLELGFLVLPILPVAMVAGAGAGAATATSKTPASIDAAISKLKQAFRPEIFEKSAEQKVVEALNDITFSGDRQCASSIRSGSGCPQTRNLARLYVDMNFFIVSGAKASSEELDFHVSTLVRADPKGVLVPDCIRWAFSQPAGNLFALTQNDSELLNREFSSFVHDVSQRLPSEIFRSVKSSNAKVSRSLTRWKRESCFYTEPEG